jgi:hypothetical protein
VCCFVTVICAVLDLSVVALPCGGAAGQGDLVIPLLVTLYMFVSCVHSRAGMWCREVLFCGMVWTAMLLPVCCRKDIHAYY